MNMNGFYLRKEYEAKTQASPNAILRFCFMFFYHVKKNRVYLRYAGIYYTMTSALVLWPSLNSVRGRGGWEINGKDGGTLIA